MQAAGYGIKKRMVSHYDIVYAAATNGTAEGAALARRWKQLYAEYVALSARYYALTKRFQKLLLEPDELVEKYQALDEAFDELQERMEPLFSDLERFAKVEPTP